MPTLVGDANRPLAYLRVEGLAAGYGGPPTVSDISLRVGAGEVVAIIGPNGAGKSTVLKALAGMLPIAAGRVAVDGQDIVGLRADQLARRGVAYVPQTKDVFALLTVTENLEMGGYLLDRSLLAQRIKEVEQVFPALARLAKRKAHNLSGGERKMLAIGRALMNSPRLLFLDEPTASLAPELAERVLEDSVRALATSGVAVLLVEQRAVAALNTSDWGYVLAAGAVHASGSPTELLASGDVGEVFLGQAGSRLTDAIAHD